MQLYFIRHAQSINNKLWAETRSDEGRNEDPDLTDLGERQAAALADFLVMGDPDGGQSGKPRNDTDASRGFDLTHIYSSLMVRSVMTGAVVAKRLDLVLHGLQEIHERGGIYLRNYSNGEDICLPGKDRDYFIKRFPEFVLPEGFIQNGWWDSRPVETREECLMRAQVFLKHLLKQHGETQHKVAIFSHGGFFNDFMTVLLRMPTNGSHWFSMYNTGITRINFRENETIVVYQNRVEHLTTTMLT
jgi:2,3-bisphosphoglycerate-dependent phosphoglycerate mutase